METGWASINRFFLVFFLIGLAGCESTQGHWIRPETAGSGTAALPANEEAFRIGTYNLYTLRHDEKLKEVFERLSFVDIWLCQEVMEPVPAKDTDSAVALRVQPLNPKLAALIPPGYPHGIFLPVKPNGDVWEGTAIISRHPIVKAEIADWEEVRTGDYIMLICRLEVRGRPLIVINTHHGTRPAQVGPLDRRSQIQALLNYVENLRKEFPDVAMIVGGDFNTAGNLVGRAAMSSTEEIMELNHSMMTGGFSPLPDSMDAASTYHRLMVRRRLDHLFYSGLECRQWQIHGDLGPSDHLPMWAEFEWSAPSDIPARFPVRSSRIP